MINFSNPKLIGENPEVISLLEKHRQTNDQQATMIYGIGLNKRDTDRVMEEWMEANESIWHSWLS